MHLPIRVLLVDDHPVVLDAISSLLRRDHRFDVVGRARTGRSALRMRRELSPDLVILDLKLPDGEAVSDLTPHVRVLVFSANESPQVAHRALVAGALGYVCKGVEASSLTDAVFRVSMGLRVVVGSTQQFASAVATLVEGSKTGTQLTPREIEILRWLLRGATNSDIAKALGISKRTVETHRARLKSKMGVATRQELYAAGGKLIDRSDAPGGPGPCQ